MVLHEVARGSLSVEVTDRGNLESAQNIEHVCEVEGAAGTGGGTTILWIIEEGTRVKKGDLLVELDSSTLTDSEKTQRIAYENALATLARAQADVETAEKALKEYEEGTFIQDRKTFEADLTVAEENLRRAQENVRFTEQLYRKGFVNKLDLEAAEFGVRNQQLLVDKAQTALNVLLNVTKDKMLTQLRGDRDAKARILAAEQTKAEQEKSRLDKIVAQLEKCKIYAKGDGMAVYYKQAGRWGNQQDQIQEGTAVRERQKIIILPDLENMHVRMLVHESKIDWIREGQPTRIRVDAFADHVLAGRVKRVATTPVQGNWFEPDKRNYPVTVTIDGSIEGLKPGMTAQTTVLVDRLTDVVTVPLQCVYTIGREQFCSVLKPDGAIEPKRAVKLGRSNDSFSEVLDGLSEGERVIQSPVEVLALNTESVDLAAKEQGEFTDADADAAKQSEPQEEGGPAAAATHSESGPSAKPAEGAPRGGRAASFNLMDNDKDGDGKVSLEEAPEMVQSWFDRIDTNGDGFVDAAENAELRKRAEEWQRQNQQGGQGPGGGPGGP